MSFSPLSLLLISLFCWRTAYFLTSESGPFDLSLRLRSRYPLGGLLTCVRCASIWTALVGFLLWRFGGEVGQAVVVVGAISGGALMLASFTGSGHV